MEKKNKIIAGLAIGALAILIASGTARCSLAPSEESPSASGQSPAIEEVQEQQGQALRQSEKTGQGDLSEIENTTWKSNDGKSTLTVLPGVLIEKKDADETLLYYTATDIKSDESGITATLSVSKEQGGKTVRAPLAVTKGNGSMRLACDALSADYSMKTGEGTISLVGADENLTGLFGKSSDDFAAAISKWASSKSPYATKAAWTKEAWIDYAAGSKVTTFTLDDGAATTVSVTLAASGELVAS